MKSHGGIQRNIVNISNYLCHDYKIYIINFDDECEIAYELNKNVEVISLSTNGHWNELVAMKACFSKIKPDLVIGFWLLNAIWAAFLKKIYHYKCIYSERNDPSNPEYGLLLRLARLIGFHFIDRFVFQHRKARDFFGSKIAKRSAIIANAVDLHNVKPKSVYSRSIKKFISVGRLHLQKNQSLMIEVFSDLINENNDLGNLTLDIYGNGELYSNLMCDIKRFGLVNNIHIHKAQTGIYQIMSEADAFLLTSSYEGMPNVLIEAMSLGLPCISTNYSCGGVDEIIDNGKNGMIVEVNNKNQLRQAIRKLCSNPAMAIEMGNNAKKIRRKHDPDYIMTKWKDLLHDLMR